MSRRPPCSIGDVVTAWRALGAVDDDERGAIAALLGHCLVDPAAAPRTAALPRPAPTPAPPAPTAKPAAPPPVTAGASLAAPVEVIELPRVAANPVPLPDPVARATSAPRASSTPLFDRGWSRTIHANLVARVAALGPIDVPRALADLTDVKVVRQLPRRPRRVSAPRVIAVRDASPAMAWFADDAAGLIDQLDAVTHAPLTRVVCDGPPRVVGTSAAPSTDESDELPPPTVAVEPATRVVAITDLGLGTAWRRTDALRLAAWTGLVAAVRACGGSVVVLTPAPLTAVPRALRRVAACVAWDERTRPAVVQRIVRALA